MEPQGWGTRGWGFARLLGLAIFAIGSATAFAAAFGSEGEGEPGITVRVYDYAHVGPGTLIAAEKQADFIFRKVGLTMRWCNLTTDSPQSLADSSCGLPAASARLDVRVVSRIKAEPSATADSTMGFAMGSSATVSYHWSKAADPKADALSGDILACVIAHEIGHLLLGSNSHSPTGIMKGKWSKEELQGAGWGRLAFTPQQGELIRAEVLARSGERRALIAQTPVLEPFSATSLALPSRRNSTARRDPGTRSADLKMSVRVYNYAEISATTLHFAEREANRIYREAGVHLEWHECYLSARAKSADSTCATPPTPADLHLRIVRRSTVTPIHALAENAGFTVGNLATVQVESLLERGRPTACFLYLMLGRAMAHEIGHVLLGGEHSAEGIMQAQWGTEQLEHSAGRSMVFTAEQAEQVRAEVRDRGRQQGTEAASATVNSH